MSGSNPLTNLQISDQDYHPLCYSIQADDENEQSALLPAFHQRKSLRIQDKIFIIFLFSILISGLAIGIYLLATEGHEWKAPGVYNITVREQWQAHVPSSTMPKLELPVRRVLFLPTNTTSCDSKSHCAKLLQELQLKHMLQWKEPDISYNFIMTADGRIFEGRGWQFETSFPNYMVNDTVTVAFLDKLETKAPTFRQAESTKIFLKVAITEGKLKRCFNTAIWGGNKFFIDLAKNVQDVLSECKGIT
ncbi:peptidoglycan-recognition protein LF-like [Tribolium madens]|uniref:peptidoglycan-recognition protein LF-like n=1 Tax=Tribolium madens TaxID=41895 RepID=UPI001CF7650F|nr:peptidoglycan-recognition protein LF-like [Tribolium madens]